MNQSRLEASGRREKRGKTTKPNIISLANHNTRNKTGALAGADRPGKRARSPLVLVLILIGCKKVPQKFQANDTENVNIHL